MGTNLLSQEGVKLEDRRTSRKSRNRFGFIVEWHVDLPNSVRHFTFYDVSWLSEKREVFGSAFQ